MSPEQITQWASAIWGTDQWTDAQLVRLTAFAQLVAAHEREQCALVCDGLAGRERNSSWGNSNDARIYTDAANLIRSRSMT